MALQMSKAVRTPFATPAGRCACRTSLARAQGVRIVASALPHSRQSVLRAAGGSAMAAAVAAGMLLAPMPAEAKLTFGRAADVAEQQADLAEAMKQLDGAIAIAARQAKKAPQVVADTASQAAEAPKAAASGASAEAKSAVKDAQSNVNSAVDKFMGQF